MDEGIRPIFSSIRHPQSNPVETVHRELGRFFRTFVRNQHTSWARYVDIIEDIINVTHHETMGFTPLELNFNIKSTRVWEKWLPIKIESNPMAHEQKVFLARERAHAFLKKQAFRKNIRTRHFEFKIGDRV